MCANAVSQNPWFLQSTSDKFKTPEMCVNAVKEVPEMLPFTPDWFVTPKMLTLAEEGGGGYETDFQEWLNGYRHRKSQKAQIQDALAPAAWHPDRAIDWCFDEDEKRVLKKLWETPIEL